ncbi:MAG: hypothetical protein ACLFUF_05660 [Opitutales bacterium]
MAKSEKGISRIDSGTTHGWFVRGYRNGKIYSKLFSDRKSGGKGKALALARDYRDELQDKLEAIPKKPRIVLSDTRNKTGELGISRVTEIDPNRGDHDCYSVSWRPEPGVQERASFSINKYGEKKAFRLAVEFRKARMREIHGPKFYRKLSKKKQRRDKSNGS